MTTPPADQKLYIVLISVHGLVRAREPELGRDPDTGGQVLYVLQLAEALARHPKVERVDLLTRLVEDRRLSVDYARPHEQIGPAAHLVRLPCGPRRYLRKENLWPHLDEFIDRALQHFSLLGRVPDVLHGHYADAGWVGARLAAILDVPLVQTGHSLGRPKQERLLQAGMSAETIDQRYNIRRRIEAEEATLDAATLVVASTRQEVEEQYGLYDNYSPERMIVLPPGVDLSRFREPRDNDGEPPIADALGAFLRHPDRPPVLAIARADRRKNLAGLVEAFGARQELRELANLVVVAGIRDDISEAPSEARRALTELLLAIDRNDLYGVAAYPRRHRPDDVPDLYRWAARHGGVFVNPAFTEPFGLTLIEAAASGLPVVATNDGGPREILERCENGVLVDPFDTLAMGDVILGAISDRARWGQWSEAGLRGAREHFSWPAHVERYLDAIRSARGTEPSTEGPRASSRRLVEAGRLLLCDIDNTLLGDREALSRLLVAVREFGSGLAFGVATGRRADSAVEELLAWGVPVPDVIVAAVGTEIYHGPEIKPDLEWQRRIDHRWDRDAVLVALEGVPGLCLQPDREQRSHKVSYLVEAEKAPELREIERRLRREGVAGNVIYSHDEYLDVLPVRASKGAALRYLAIKWDLPLEHVLVAGDSGNDEEMLLGDTLGVVVGNYSPELERLRGSRRVYFAEAPFAGGILEGAAHYDFFGELRFDGAWAQGSEEVLEEVES